MPDKVYLRPSLISGEGLIRGRQGYDVAAAETDRLSEFQGAESGIRAERHLEKRGNRLRGASESCVICALEIPRAYTGEKVAGRDFLRVFR